MKWQTFDEVWFADRLNEQPKSLLHRLHLADTPVPARYPAQMYWTARKHGGMDHPGLGREEMSVKPFRELKEQALPPWYYRKLQAAVPRYAAIAGELFMDLDRIVDGVCSFEWQMQANVEKFYRDHLLHQLKVGYIGQWVMDLVGGEENYAVPGDPAGGPGSLGHEAAMVYAHGPESASWRSHARFLGFSRKETMEAGFWYQPVLRAFWLAALSHDVGIPVEFLRARFERLAGLRFLEGRFDRGDLLRALKSLGNRPLLFPFTGFTPRLRPEEFDELWFTTGELIYETYLKTHSFTSALHLLLFIQEMHGVGFVSPELTLVFDMAALAVLQHDLDKMCWIKSGSRNVRRYPPPKDIQLSVRWPQHPVGYLLMLADQLQDFGRPNRQAGKPAGQLMNYEFKVSCPAVMLRTVPANPLPRLDVQYLYHEPELAEIRRRGFIESRRRKFFDPQNGLLRHGPFSGISIRAKRSPA